MRRKSFRLRARQGNALLRVQEWDKFEPAVREEYCIRCWHRGRSRSRGIGADGVVERLYATVAPGPSGSCRWPLPRAGRSGACRSNL
jgi:hypothetical protein